MTEREKVQKAFNQCSDALSQLEQKLILKVFHLLSVQFDIVSSPQADQQTNKQLNEPSFSNSKAAENDEHLEEAQVVKKSNNPRKTKTATVKNPVFLADFDFRPSGQESLKEFYQKYNARSNFEKNLVFVYYLQNVTKVSNITVNHIFSSYRHLGLKIPLFPQTLIDTKARKGWIDTANMSDIKVTREGINFLEHDMAKADEA